MSVPTYANIQPLIASQETKGTTVHVSFSCPKSGALATASSTIARSDSIQSTAARSAKKSFWASLRKTVLGAIGDTLGRGAAGRVARDVASTSMTKGQANSAFSKEEVEGAVVQAFVSVQDQFQWDESTEGWQGVVVDGTASEQAA